jgi:hypothetical protein
MLQEEGALGSITSRASAEALLLLRASAQENRNFAVPKRA